MIVRADSGAQRAACSRHAVRSEEVMRAREDVTTPPALTARPRLAMSGVRPSALRGKGGAVAVCLITFERFDAASFARSCRRRLKVPAVRHTPPADFHRLNSKRYAQAKVAEKE